MSGASALAQVFYSGKPRKRPDRDFVRDLHVKLGALPSQQTTQALVKQANQSIHPLHRLPPPFAKKPSEDGMAKTASISPQDCPAKPRKVQPLADQVREALTADFGNLKARQKEIARKAGGISPRTVERWERGEGVPHLELFLELGKHSPSMRAVALRFWAMEADQDPGFQRELIAFLQSRARR